MVEINPVIDVHNTTARWAWSWPFRAWERKSCDELRDQ
jgi:hypothetical protein